MNVSEPHKDVQTSECINQAGKERNVSIKVCQYRKTKH